MLESSFRSPSSNPHYWPSSSEHSNTYGRTSVSGTSNAHLGDIHANTINIHPIVLFGEIAALETLTAVPRCNQARQNARRPGWSEYRPPKRNKPRKRGYTSANIPTRLDRFRAVDAAAILTPPSLSRSPSSTSNVQNQHNTNHIHRRAQPPARGAARRPYRRYSDSNATTYPTPPYTPAPSTLTRHGDNEYTVHESTQQQTTTDAASIEHLLDRGPPSIAASQQPPSHQCQPLDWRNMINAGLLERIQTAEAALQNVQRYLNDERSNE
ncbi:hypothetical protein H2198_002731 [Neophaeococcomyces mojaviensis]|uniref:Uncharacterized protein n=1 Tax=Neophaeococcomyces mojaviensis TaxID=3383035 RepID=A0ACC3ADH2_9EURO|nr:hypothetical protein H2198_002731 [Knufia sp. JES_112]